MLYSLLLGLLLALPLAAQDSPPAALAADDQVVFVRKGDLWSVRGDGSGLRQITRAAVQELRPVASPDGSLIAYEVYDADRGDFGLWTCTPEGGDPTQIIERARNVSWSPDGGRLLFAMQRRSRLDIWMANRQGTDLVRITNTPEQDYLPVWSPAGDRVAFVRELHEGGRTRYAIVVRSADGNEQEVTSLLGRNIASLSWAPSESLLYSARGEAPNEPERLYRLAADALLAHAEPEEQRE
ncbi:MAG: PD40 domain-containing protein [Armatimonadetes bacterium]|nr:PD40 domain-containing protein [Armatimonadota bacterium]